MNKVQYGNKTIEYSFEQNDELKSHYISVEKTLGVCLKGKLISNEQADLLILKKARWIIEKLDLLSVSDEGNIQTGSRLTYLGRSYYVSLFIKEELRKVIVEFTHSKFNIYLSSKLNTQAEIKAAIEYYKKVKAIEKITPRFKKWSANIGLRYNSLLFKKMDKSWGSCSVRNNILISFDAVQLPWALIDYLIVHELVHTKIKNHSKEFWAEVSKHIPNWQELDERMGGLKI